jgi:branched-chain amino acid transport system substrate-binding protein
MFRIRLIFLLVFITALSHPIGVRADGKKYGPGVTDTEIKIGQTMPYGGPASAYATCGISHQRVFKSINDQGGINGRKIDLISLDDEMMPPKTVEQVRRLVERDNVLLLFGVLGPGALSILDYVDRKKVPFLFPSGAARKFHQPDKHPWTMGWLPPFEFEGRMYARFILKERPNAKIGILWENNDMGREGLDGVKLELGDRASKMIVAEASYLLTDPTVDSQIISLKGVGADTVISMVSAKFAALAIRKIHDIGWHPLHLISYSGSGLNVLEMAGLEKSRGLISAYFAKTVTDPVMRNDEDVKQYYAWKAKFYPEGNINDGCIDYGYTQAHLLIQVLKQCGDDLTRENVMRQAQSLHNVRLPLLVPGITINTSQTDYRPIEAMQFQRFDGHQWIFFGDLMTEK